MCEIASIQRQDAESNVTVIADPMVAMIERVVCDPNASVEKLERMLAMKERLEDRALEETRRHQKQAYYQAMSKCQEQLKVITKNKNNEHTKSRYADLAALAEQADPVIHKHGFTVSFQPAGTNEKGELSIKWTIAHEGGHIESDTADIPVDNAGSQGKVNKTGTQAFGSTMTYGRRYLKLMLFDIATGDDNDGNAKVAPISEDQLNELLTMADEYAVDKAKFCEFFEIDSFAAIKSTDFKKAKSALEAKRKKVTQ
jgi:hypothetical protein